MAIHVRSWLLVLLSFETGASALHVAVAGATGRTGALVVQRLLDGGHSVRALVRNAEKAASVLPTNSDHFSVHVVDLGTADAAALGAACKDTERCIWCATGFTEDGESIDMKGMTALPAAYASSGSTTVEPPTIVMLSSAGVTRPAWDEKKKDSLIGASDIPSEPATLRCRTHAVPDHAHPRPTQSSV